MVYPHDETMNLTVSEAQKRKVRNGGDRPHGNRGTRPTEVLYAHPFREKTALWIKEMLEVPANHAIS